MISKNQIKIIRSLERKKGRMEHNLFVAEGKKVISDLLGSFDCCAIYETTGTFASVGNQLPCSVEPITTTQLEQISFLRQPQGEVALFRTRQYDITRLDITPDKLILALDGVQDPGNMGTIIRTADWFGIHDIVCSDTTADIFNPKVVQATMGALARVRVYYTDLCSWLRDIKKVPVYGTLLNGTNIYQVPLSSGGIIIMGNEGNGISEAVRQYIDSPLLIPNYPIGAPTSESLNVGIATALVCSEFRRRTAQNPTRAD